MSKKVASGAARKRTKKPGKIADLPAKPMQGKDAAAVKGGAVNAYLNFEGTKQGKV